MSIWYKENITIEELVALSAGNMVEHLGIEWMQPGENELRARMPVDQRTVQPYGFLHGGASCVLAETLGSAASMMAINQEIFYCAGIEINANHIRGVKKGFVYGVCTPVHIGYSTHVWDIRITDDETKLVCVSRLTVAILKKKN